MYTHETGPIAKGGLPRWRGVLCRDSYHAAASWRLHDVPVLFYGALIGNKRT